MVALVRAAVRIQLDHTRSPVRLVRTNGPSHDAAVSIAAASQQPFAAATAAVIPQHSVEHGTGRHARRTVVGGEVHERLTARSVRAPVQAELQVPHDGDRSESNRYALPDSTSSSMLSLGRSKRDKHKDATEADQSVAATGQLPASADPAERFAGDGVSFKVHRCRPLRAR